MKLKTLYSNFCLAVLVAASMTLTGCIFEDGQLCPDKLPADYYFTLRVKLPVGEGSRALARDFEYGEEYEHQLDPAGEHLLLCFDSKWILTGVLDMNFLADHYEHESNDPTNPGHTLDDTNVEAMFFCELSQAQKNNLPDHGLIVLNAYNLKGRLNQLLLNQSNIQTVLALMESKTDSHEIGRAGNYFTMSSTAYLEKGSNGNWVHKMYFDFDPDNFFEDKEEAKQNPVAVAYAERMVAKFSIKFSGASEQNGMLRYRPSNPDVQVCRYFNGTTPEFQIRKWYADIISWGIAGREQQSFIFKNIIPVEKGSGSNMSGQYDEETGEFIPGTFNPETGEFQPGSNPAADRIVSTTYPFNFGSDIDTYTQIPFFPYWNDATNHRSYWAVDPHYTDVYYPLQFRTAVGEPDIEHYDKGIRVLEYLSYNELSPDLYVYGSSDYAYARQQYTAPVYAPENTFPDGVDERGRWENSFAGTHVIVGAEIHFQNFDEYEYGSNYDVFRNRTGVFFLTKYDFMMYLITTMNSQLYAQKELTYRYYNWDYPLDRDPGIGQYHKLNLNNIKDYQVCYNGKPLSPDLWYELDFFIPADIEGGDGKILPWIEGMYIARVDPDGTVMSGTEINLDSNSLKSLIYEWVGAFDHFKDGRMYYLTSIRHEAQSAVANAETGDYGVVRNHWYKLDVQSINGIGIPVDVPDQKIIPYQARLDNSVIFEIKVLDWHSFETKVELPDSPMFPTN